MKNATATGGGSSRRSGPGIGGEEDSCSSYKQVANEQSERGHMEISTLARRSQGGSSPIPEPEPPLIRVSKNWEHTKQLSWTLPFLHQLNHPPSLCRFHRPPPLIRFSSDKLDATITCSTLWRQSTATPILEWWTSSYDPRSTLFSPVQRAKLAFPHMEGCSLIASKRGGCSSSALWEG